MLFFTFPKIYETLTHFSILFTFFFKYIQTILEKRDSNTGLRVQGLTT